ncbi:MAG: hypothetical protein ABJA82_05450 [Myxococcales bacterium]
MSAASGEGGRSIEGVRNGLRASGGVTATPPELVPFGKEQQEQKWQFGEHCPPETSVGQLSSH